MHFSLNYLILLKLKHLISFSLLLILLPGCSRWDDYRTVRQQEEGALHLYLEPKDTGNSLSGTIYKDVLKKIDTFNEGESYKNNWQLPKAFIRGQVVFVDPYYGLLIYNKKDGDTGYYLRVIGAYDADSTAPYQLTVKTSIGKAIINMTNPDEPEVVSFVFDYQGYAPPISYGLKKYLTRKNFCNTHGCKWRYYFQCPINPGKIIFGWKAGTLTTDPICFAYTD
jgi:hypothetical protein